MCGLTMWNRKRSGLLFLLPASKMCESSRSDRALRARWFLPIFDAPARSRALRWKAIGSLSVTLRAQPRDATVSVYPVLCISFAFQAGDFSDRDSWIFGQDFPVVFCSSNDSEGHLYFCHAVPCMEIGPKRTRLRRACAFEVMPQTGWQPVWISTSIFSTVCID